jgi:DNA-binding response OmpR family regulator
MAVELELRHAQSIIELKEASPSILVIDPDPAFCIVVGIMLKLKDYSIRRAHTISAALSILELIQPDLIVVNRTLLINDTNNLVSYLRSCDEFDHIPLIAIQPNPKVPEHGAIEGLKVDARLNRPFTANELHELIGGLI